MCDLPVRTGGSAADAGRVVELRPIAPPTAAALNTALCRNPRRLGDENEFMVVFFIFTNMNKGEVMALGIQTAGQSAEAARLRYERLFIGGDWVAPVDGGIIVSIDPATGRVWAEVAFGGPRDIDRAVAAAREAFEGPWGRMPGWERAALIRRLAELYQKHAPEMAVLESRDSGRAHLYVNRIEAIQGPIRIPSGYCT